MLRLMLKLVKWSVYVGVGYVIYELIAGMSSGDEHEQAGAPAPRPVSATHAPGVNLTGRGAGTHTNIDNGDGGHRSTTVGRGVIRR